MSDTKLVGDIAEQAVILEALVRGFNVLTPIGDRLPYDLVLEHDGVFTKIQVKSSWLYNGASLIETRQCKTNRKIYRIEKYKENDFNFTIAFIPEQKSFYILPIDFVLKYAGIITLESKGKRKMAASEFKEAWNLILAD